MRHELKHTVIYQSGDSTKKYSRTFTLKDSATKEQAKNLALGYENFLSSNYDDHTADYVSYDTIDLDD